MSKAKPQPQVLLACTSPSRLEELTAALDPLMSRGVAATLLPKVPSELHWVRLLVYEGEPVPEYLASLLEPLPARRHAILAFPGLSLAHVAYFLGDSRVSHLYSAPVEIADLGSAAEKLATGSIFGLERHLPAQADVHYRRLESYEERCALLEEIDASLRRAKVRSSVRRAGAQVAEELLMNAMYQAPRDGSGNQVFAEIDPARRIHRTTPRPVSLRYSIADGALYVAVRDRYGSFQRHDLARALRRCLKEPIQIEQKKLGAGLGLYLCASSASRFVVNVMPGQISEFICVIEPRTRGTPVLRELSVTVHRPLP